MRRPAAFGLLLGSLIAAACSSDQTIPQPATAPDFAGGAGPNSCASIESLRAVIPVLFPPQLNPTPQFNQLVAALARGDEQTARKTAFSMADQTLRSYRAVLLIGGTSAATQTNVLTWVNGLFCIAGIQTVLPPGALLDDGAAAIITPTSPTTTIVTGTQFAGVQVNTGATPQTTLLTIVRLPDSPAPLLTPLDQYPLFYEFSTGPTVTFTQAVTVGVCQPSSLVVPDPTRLRVGHNIAPFTPGSTEILPLAPVAFVDCTNAQLGLSPAARWFGRLLREITPTPLYASLATTGLGGLTHNFSPFGAVDTLGRVDANSSTQLTGHPGQPVSPAPSIALRTPTGNPMPGITVTFAVASGGGSVTGGTQVTDAHGNATVGSWKLGPATGTNTLTATATPPQGAGFLNNRIVFTAIAN